MTQPAAATTTHNELGVRIRLYQIPHPDTGELLSLPNISSVVDVLQTWGLADWKLRQAAAGLVARQDLQARVAVALPMPGGRDRNRQILDAVEDAIAHGQTIDPDRGHLANDLGSAVHLLTEHIDAGLVDDPLNLPNSVAEYAANYITLMAAHGVQVVESEFTVHGDGYAGTGDRIVTLEPTDSANAAVFDRLDLGRGLFALDIKTGRVSPKAAMQLAALANAKGIWDAEAEAHRPLPDGLRTDIGFLLHLTAEGANLVPVDLADAWPAFQGALAVKTFCDSKPLHPALVAPKRTTTVAETKRAAENAEARALLEGCDVHTGVPAADAYREPDPVDLQDAHAVAEPVHISETLKQAIAAIPDDPDAGTVDEVGRVKADRQARTAYLAERLGALIDTHGDTLPLTWPDEVPTFRAHREAEMLHTGDQLDAIEAAIAAVERQLVAPFPPDDPSDVAARRVAPDDPRATDIAARFAALPADIRNDVADAAKAAGVKRFSLGEGTEQCIATWHRILQPAEADAALAADQAHNAAAVLHQNGWPADLLLVLVGNHVDAPTIWQANRLDELADAAGLDFVNVADGTATLTDAGRKHLEAEFGGRRGVLNAAKTAADLLGLPKPTKADDVYGDVLLAAHLTLVESEPVDGPPTEISPPNPAA